ncbi:MAG: GNAT family N-acetyltransferase [Ponticaulis sp.]|nr:GNAT family N-acetyltransferase [Ponticaulis sp.]
MTHAAPGKTADNGQGTHTSLKRVLLALRDVSPMIAGPLLFAGGGFHLLSAALPQLTGRLKSLSDWLPLGVIEFSHLAGSIVGTLMMFVAFGVFRRLQGARILGIALCASGSVFTWLHGASYLEAIYLAGLCLLLALSGPAYWRQTGVSNMTPAPVWLLVFVIVICLVGWVGLIRYQSVPYSDELWWRFVLDGDVSRYLRAAAAVLATCALIIIWVLFQPKQPLHFSTPEASELANWLDAAEEARPVTRFALTGDKFEFVNEDGSARLFFAVRGNAWISMGGPAGDPDKFSDLVWKFRMEADRHNAWTALYSIEESELSPVLDCGLTVRKIGESAILPLPDFSLAGGSKSSLRQIMRKGEKEGLTLEVQEAGQPISDELASELRRVSDAWLSAHGGHEKSFSLGQFDPDFLSLGMLAIIRQNGRAVAFVSLLVDPKERRMLVDLMRYHEAPPQTMEWSFLNIALWGQENGWAELDLGMAPLSGLSSRRFSPMTSRLGAMAFDHGEAVYGFEGLRQFKSKFRPVWRPLYLASPAGPRAVFALLTVALLTAGGWRNLLSGGGK